MYNCYGPTETTVFCTVDVFSDASDVRLDGVSAPIGTPLPGVIVEFHPTSAEEFEIVIRGATVGLGYDNSGQEHSSGYSSDEEGNLFRTGDYVELIGREAYFKRRGDRQVKLRGNRFELDEAESILKKNSCFDCVFSVHDDSLFLFVGPGCKCTDEKLLRVCAEHLPNFAQPRKLIRVDLWPVSMNVKLDVNALLEMIDNGE